MKKQNESIPQDLKQQLKQDAQWFQQQSESPSKQAELLSKIDAQLKNVQVKEVQPIVTSKKNQTLWLLPVAAAVCLALWVGNDQSHQTTPAVQSTTINKPFELVSTVKQWPFKLERQTQQKFDDEQQAIIADLQTLKGRWLNI